ncbi:unnamed protein product [Lepeophtheirus salmonis]|uniref:(salmon louse) hypothetical protein n=1 Tax=Lepeophtheirus salmonis TaxID=72036 RepID=A0A7R8CML5_LEPSM|nr:unnamed protein product [Lepeophtheirus salmonis]CAF2822851.1 unnamed protein product [Lepeophtheirus salmonis]
MLQFKIPSVLLASVLGDRHAPHHPAPAPYHALLRPTNQHPTMRAPNPMPSNMVSLMTTLELTPYQAPAPSYKPAPYHAPPPTYKPAPSYKPTPTPAYKPAPSYEPTPIPSYKA